MVHGIEGWQDSCARKRCRVVILTRGIGATSFPWNELYHNFRSLRPGIQFPPAAVGSGSSQRGWQWGESGSQQRRHLRLGPAAALWYIMRLASRSRRKSRALIVHIHSPVLAPFALLTRLLAPHVKIVVTQHNDWRFFRRHQKLGLSLLAKVSDQYTTCGRAIKRTLPAKIRSTLEETGRLSSIPNSINTAWLQAFDTPAGHGASEGGNGSEESRARTAVVIARMVPQKNCQFLLETFAECNSLVSLIWFGDGVERHAVEETIQCLGLQGRVELRGMRPREEVFAALASSGFYFNASKWEGLCVADLEAAALGCWPIMSDIPQRQEVAEALGIRLFPLGDQTPWRDGVEEFLARPAYERAKLRQATANATRESFGMETMLRRYDRVYAEAQRSRSG